MKKIIIALLLFFNIGVFAQQTLSPEMIKALKANSTTLTEYNYIKLGYADNIAKGQDIKQGYRAYSMMNQKVVSNTNLKRSVEFINFYRADEQTPCGTLMKCTREDTGVTVYFCIPAFDSPAEIWKKAEEDYWKLTANWNEIGQSYSFPMIKYISLLNKR